MQKSIKVSLFSLAFLIILPLAAMQSEDLPEWKRKQREKPAFSRNTNAFAPRRRSFSSDDRFLSPAEQKVQEALKQDPKKAAKVLSQSVSEPSSPATARQIYTREQLMAFASAYTKAPQEILKSIKSASIPTVTPPSNKNE